ncbi:MAG: hypothetical protein GX567_15685 [Clostridia bacterium]|nr:hypothetical protein [Clostridia bacterium]
MNDIAYFTKVQFETVTRFGQVEDRMILNIPQRELSFQVFRWKKQMPAISGYTTEDFHGHVYSFNKNIPARVVRNGKTKKSLLESEQYEEQVVFSYGVRLTEEQIEDLLPYCNAKEFDTYRNKKMSMSDEGYVGYRDEVTMRFCGITDSYIPLLELSMSYFYDEEHEWPSERLYRYLVQTYFNENKKTKGWGPTYGAFSLFC